MNTIVVPTDFSAPAENAMMYAGNIAKRTGATIYLLHVYQVPVSMNDVPVMLVSAEELKKNADSQLFSARDTLQKRYPDIEIKTEARLGDAIDEVNELCRQLSPELIIVGRHGATGVERLLFGSTSLSLIRHTDVPVIVVPDTYTGSLIKNIAIAAEQVVEGIPVQTIRNFAEEMNASLHVIHVQLAKTEARELHQLVPGLTAEYTTIHDTEFIHGIQSYAEANNIDLIIVLPKKHTLIERMFFKPHTTELMENLSLPLMCINEI